MTVLEDRLAAAADALRQDVGRTADVESALARTVDSTPALRQADRRSRRGRAVLVAAAVIVLAAVVGAMLLRDDEEPLVADGGVPTTTADDPAAQHGQVTYELLGEFPRSPQRSGSIAYAGIPDAYTDQWLFVTPAPAPEVDFERQIVLAFTVAHFDGCPLQLAELEREGDLLRPAFVLGQAESDECGPSPVSRTFIIAVDRDDLPSTFSVELPPALDGSDSGQRTTFDLSTNAGSHVPPSPDADGPVVDGPDLQAPAVGREITFDGMGDVLLGQVLDPSEVQLFEGSSSCGYWGPQEPTHDGDEPVAGLVSGAGGPSPRVWTIMAGRNSTYRTASGVGVGTALATLQRIYGDRLVVDRVDQDQTPTDGLVGWYQDVAAVRYGENALTFYLSGDVVTTVKLSPADFWGDDEGCA